MVPLPIDNELDHMLCARAFIEKYALARLAGIGFQTSPISSRSTCRPGRKSAIASRFRGHLRHSPARWLAETENSSASSSRFPRASPWMPSLRPGSRNPASTAYFFCCFCRTDIRPREACRKSAGKRGARVSASFAYGIGGSGATTNSSKSPLLSAPADEDGPSIIKGQLASAEKAFLKRWMDA